MRKPFLVGRATVHATELLILAPDPAPLFPGPWTLRGLVDVRLPHPLPAA